jgi:RNA polymerase sigma-70 factor (TIGR02960 family)
MSQSLLARAARGEQDAFRELTDPYRRELQFHCYRILGSMHDAEDALQETLVSAWRGLAGFEQRSGLRAWLYRIATNCCLDALRAAGRRLPPASEPPFATPAPTRMAEVTWLEPYPDALLEGIIDTTPGPEARYETRETIELAFIAALQALPPRQRAALLLRDVLGFHAAEVAGMLDSSEDSVKGALKRARSTIDRLQGAQPRHPAPLPDSNGERELVRRFADAWVAADIDSVVALLADNAWVSMPPSPLEYQGHTTIAAFLRAIFSRRGERRYTLIPTRANTQPAFGSYRDDEHAPIAHAVGVLVLTIEGERISAVTSFSDSSLLPHFGLPRTLRL